jgi:hypothetical protein
MIYFFVGNNNGIGGMQNLFLGISSELNKMRIESRIIANPDSYIGKVLLSESKSSWLLNMNVFNDWITDFNVEKDILIISGNVSGLELFYEINPRILVWNVFPESFIYANRIRSFHFKYYTRKLLRYLDLNKSVVFMDKFCFDTNNAIFKLSYNEGESILPIPIIVGDNKYLKRRNFTEKNEINVTYLGRVSDFKFYPVLRLVTDLIKIKLNLNSSINLIILTDDKNFFYNKFDQLSSQLSISYQENLYGEKLDDFLCCYSDIHFGMGLSCLEGAKLGIPSIMLDYGYIPFPDNYEYRWLHNMKGYILGENITTLKYSGLNNLNKIFFDLHLNSQKISELTYSYVQAYHSINPIIDKFLLFVGKSSGKLMDFYNLCLINNPFIHFINSSLLRTRN